MTSDEQARLAQAIPAIADIVDTDVRAAVVRTWAKALSSSPYASLDEAPFSSFLPTRSLLEHVNNVNTNAISFIAEASNRYGLAVNSDVALAATILHDVDKVLIFRWDGTTFSLAEGTGKADHGKVGAALALDMGVPEEIALLIRDHSQMNSRESLPASAEATIMLYADMVDADLASVRYGSAPSYVRNRPVAR